MDTDNPKEIEVRFSPSEVIKCSSEWQFLWMCLGKLREAGIPIKGVFVFRGIKSGVLTRTNDYESGDIVFSWKAQA